LVTAKAQHQDFVAAPGRAWTTRFIHIPALLWRRGRSPRKERWELRGGGHGGKGRRKRVGGRV